MKLVKEKGERFSQLYIEALVNTGAILIQYLPLQRAYACETPGIRYCLDVKQPKQQTQDC